MPNDLIQYAYVSGEINPRLHGRSDLEKYDLGLSLARNWYVDPEGGLSTRSSTIFSDWLQSPEYNIRYIPFEFSPNIANTTKIIFGKNYIRFTQEGSYLLEAAKNIVGIDATAELKLTIPAHGYSNGDLGKIVSLSLVSGLTTRTYEIVVVSANVIMLKNQFSNFVSSPLVGLVTGTFARVYSIANPFLPEHFGALDFKQYRNLIRISSYLYPTYDLIRAGATSWSITPTVFDSQVPAPDNLVAVASGTGEAGVVYTVTAIDKDGNESLAADSILMEDIINFTVTAGEVLLNWDPVPGAKYYHIYRSIVGTNSDNMSRGQQVGYLGKTFGPTFLDTNIIPDFSVTPPVFSNPFVNGAITHIDVTAEGTGYWHTDTLTVTDGTGTGFVGYAVVRPSGAVGAIAIVNGGKNYTAPTITLSGGTGATFTAELGLASGNYPAVSAIFQGRQLYAGTVNIPLGIWGSRPGRFNNFDVSSIIVDNDSYSFELDSAQVAMTNHLIPMRGGLLIFNQIGIWQLTGGQNGAVTPTNALAEPQSYTGISDLPPLRIDAELLYIEAKGYTARLLSYNDLTKLYAGTNISVLSSHFFGKGYDIVSWAYAQEPSKLIHAVREDGRFLFGTLVKDQNLYAWTLGSTRGLYKQVLSIREDRSDSVYYDIQRYINGKTVRYIEKLGPRNFEKIEDAWAVDCALRYAGYTPETTLILSANTGTTTATSVLAAFDNTMVGYAIFFGDGKAVITAYISPFQVTVDILRPSKKYLYPETENLLPFVHGKWTLNQAVSVLTNLDHLEGEYVDVLADGNVIQGLQVVNGSVTLEEPAYIATVGLPYKCIAQTLPLTANGQMIEGKHKSIVGISARVHESRGLKMGTRLDQLYETKERRFEAYNQPTDPRTGIEQTFLTCDWNEDGQTYYVVDVPLPVTILGHIATVGIGDDPD